MHNLGQAAISPSFIFSYILFRFECVKYKKVSDIILTMVFIGLSCNYYLPHYMGSVLLVFIILFLLGSRDYALTFFSLILRNKRIIIIALILGALAASPALFVYKELKEFISPSRGAFTQGIAVPIGESGAEERGPYSLKMYSVAADRFNDIQGAFYSGVLFLLMAPWAFHKRTRRFALAILVSMGFSVWMSMGINGGLFAFFIRHVPTFSVMRHSFQFSQFFSFFLIIFRWIRIV